MLKPLSLPPFSTTIGGRMRVATVMRAVASVAALVAAPYTGVRLPTHSESKASRAVIRRIGNLSRARVLRHSGVEKIPDQLVEGTGVFNLRPVTAAPKHMQLRPHDPLMQGQRRL